MRRFQCDLDPRRRDGRPGLEFGVDPGDPCYMQGGCQFTCGTADQRMGGERGGVELTHDRQQLRIRRWRVCRGERVSPVSVADDRGGVTCHRTEDARRDRMEVQLDQRATRPVDSDGGSEPDELVGADANVFEDRCAASGVALAHAVPVVGMHDAAPVGRNHRGNGLSRVVLGMHFLSDVLAGIVLGVALGCCALTTYASLGFL